MKLEHPPSGKRCGSCRQILPDTAFYRSSRTKTGLHCYCKTCSSKKSSANKRKWRRTAAGRAAYKRYWLGRYGLSVEQYNAMLAAQGGRCETCPNAFDDTRSGRACVDHHHATGKVRALLCGSCNAALGMAKENPVILRALARYLETHHTYTLEELRCA
jgi:hypothetical protein